MYASRYKLQAWWNEACDPCFDESQLDGFDSGQGVLDYCKFNFQLLVFFFSEAPVMMR